MSRVAVALVGLAVALSGTTNATAGVPVAVWQWVVCTPSAERVWVEIENLSAQGYRFRIRHWFYGSGVLDRTVTRDPWVAARSEKQVSDIAEPTDTTIRTQVVRGHYTTVNGWQAWVTDENLMDVTVPGCDT